MRFPYQLTLGIQLRDYADVDRKNSYARNLGLSSITKGEGSIDLLPNDTSTTPAAQFGDLEDGTFGVGARIDGVMTNLGVLGKQHSTTLASHNTRITAEKNRNDTQDQRLSSTESKNSQQDQRLDSHASRIGAVENAVGNAASTGDIATLNSKILTLNSQVHDLRERVEALERLVKPD